jgi:hypothetical protein
LNQIELAQLPLKRMKTTRLSHLGHLLLVLALAAATGCSTLRYRSVQSQFEETVRADNERFTMPFTDVASAYQTVANELTEDYITRLDPKLRPNAWTLRAVSQWRAGESTQAVDSSGKGLDEIDRLKQQTPQLENGRDSIILTMVPGLVEDSRLRQRFAKRGAADVAAHYDEYAAKFKTALRALTEARAKAGSATPIEVIHYWDFQCWRVLANWLYTISQLPLEAQADANKNADKVVKETLANTGLADVTTLPKAMSSAENALPNEHPYRQLIALERQR